MKICNSNNKSTAKFSMLKAFSFIMMLLIVITSTNLSAFAAGTGGVGGEENTGGGETGGGSNSQSTWSGASQSGYRITIVDDNLVPVVRF